MATRGKRPKVGLTRMDAALDAMRPLGFSAQVIRKSVKKLLEVYGGDKWWFAIEEAGYKLLIDTILEEELEEKQIQDGNVNEEQHEEQDPQESHEIVKKTQEDDFEAENCLPLKEAIPNDLAIECTPTPTRVLLPPPDFLPTSPKRKPTYGWISDDDTEEEDENDFVTLTPARRSSFC
ncbi:hypothetical protein LguiA_034859 [Lonicera macranthoides]